MPGDRIKIDASHIQRANAAFPMILERLRSRPDERLVVSVYGGSGVGKSEVGSIIGAYCATEGYPAYVLSGDNYPYRIPPQNDIERLNRFRSAGLAAIARHDEFCEAWNRDIHAAWPSFEDADPARARDDRGFAVYQRAGRAALERYLGSAEEIDFDLVNAIIARFAAGSDTIAVKRMGRTPGDVHIVPVDVSRTRVLIVEWTHGNNPRLSGIDLPVFLYSSPEETLAHRRSRGRDSDTDSAFIRLVLDIEQALVNARSESAAMVIGKDGRIIGAIR
jgi:hypothetical protein